MPIKKGDKVKIDYEGSLEDGQVFDSSQKHGAPLEIEVGAGKVIKGFDDALIGMEKDQEKTITLKPEEAYGERNEEMLKKIPRDKLPTDQEPKEGMMIMLKSADGREIPVPIKAVDEKEITIDFNHPLAGKTLTFKLKVVEIGS
ncbi:peptidylprolyl isomerase [Nanoarchaeota archaeon]